MSEERVHELHREMASKLIEKAKISKDSSKLAKIIELDTEIILIRRDINEELQRISG
ncbi:hypothetical protein KAU18_08665 [Candidatus Bathyarchaeota archaeon]|nr:hypothetical protein [Candidatus Bathyarchaeota archaeon]MCK4701776.1 hypothetical protein [Candidatus Bathyarchaeota archaeon]